MVIGGSSSSSNIGFWSSSYNTPEGIFYFYISVLHPISLFYFFFCVFVLRYFWFDSNLFLCSPLPDCSLTCLVSACCFFYLLSMGFTFLFFIFCSDFSWVHFSSLLGGSYSLTVGLFLLLSLFVFLLFLLLLLPLTHRIFSPCNLVFLLLCTHLIFFWIVVSILYSSHTFCLLSCVVFCSRGKSSFYNCAFFPSADVLHNLCRVPSHSCKYLSHIVSLFLHL